MVVVVLTSGGAGGGGSHVGGDRGPLGGAPALPDLPAGGRVGGSRGRRGCRRKEGRKEGDLSRKEEKITKEGQRVDERKKEGRN